MHSVQHSPEVKKEQNRTVLNDTNSYRFVSSFEDTFDKDLAESNMNIDDEAQSCNEITFAPT